VRQFDSYTDPLFGIHFPIRSISCQCTFLAGILETMFHSQKTTVSLVIDMLENIFIVYLSGSGFFSARSVPYLEIGYFIPAIIYRRNQVPFFNLYVIYIAQYFHAGT